MFWERFTEECKKVGKKPNPIAVSLGISPSALTKWKKGGMPSMDSLNRLSNYFGVTSDYLMGNSDVRTRIPKDTAEVIIGNRGLRPIVGNVSAGVGVIAEQDIIGYQSVDESYDRDDCFWLKVFGDSMSPMINSGDLILVDKSAEIRSGSIAVAMVDDEGYIKRVQLHDQTIELVSINPYYPPMVFKGKDANRVEFVGKVVRLEREL